uniref:Retrotransposon gag domain-containing protein n=1 Tax=Cajanus cajan TaxID=3821 RepID=A0A151SIC4_CAJCA|nr:hypothetical protein KK1_000669 [Cajanus cajan]
MGELPYNGPRERTLREMAAPDFTYESLCIQYPEEDVPFVLKTRLIHLLPKFHGHACEDPHKHLKGFHIVCSTMKPPDVQEDNIYLKAFPHSLEGVAKDWLYYLAPRCRHRPKRASAVAKTVELAFILVLKMYWIIRTTCSQTETLSILSNLFIKCLTNPC